MPEITNQDKQSCCLWCGKPTNRQNSNIEHIFPVAIGGKKTLPLGSVCEVCNSRLSFLDEALKYGHESMLDAFQADVGIKGRVRNKDDRERKERERMNITGKGDAKEMKISRQGSDIYLVNADFIITTLTFVRALHKCSTNILCHNYGSVFARENYRELLTFVNEGKDVLPWSYAVSFANPFKRPLISDPMSILIQAGQTKITGFLHSSGIWVTGSQPFGLNQHIIEAVSEIILKKIVNDNCDEALDCFGFNYESNNRDSIGKLKFLWIVKEMEGKPNDDFLQLLTKCRLCGQTNPTGILLSRDIICNGDLNKKVSYPKNSWNRYSVEDLRRIGIRADCLDKNQFDNYMNQGMSIPIVNDVRNLEILDCKTKCVNCGNVITYNAKDCFV
jgi:hypothetical protein